MGKLADFSLELFLSKNVRTDFRVSIPCVWFFALTPSFHLSLFYSLLRFVSLSLDSLSLTSVCVILPIYCKAICLKTRHKPSIYQFVILEL